MKTVSWFIRRKALGVMGAVILIGWILVAIFAKQIAPYDPDTQAFRPFEPPGKAHLIGTDRVGRDLFSRIVYGSRISILVGVSTVAIGFFVSMAIGVVSAFWGGPADLLVQRIVDILMSFPGLLLALLVAGILGQSVKNVIIAISLGKIVGGLRLVRGQVLTEREKDYVMSARVIGCSSFRICFRHINPNIVPMAIIMAAGGIGDAMLSEAGMSFLGLGVPPPTATWGGELSLGRGAFMIAPWLAIFPGLALSSTVLAFNVFGDALRDTMDPWLRRGRQQ